MGTVAALIYIPFPDAPEAVVIGVGAALGILGEQGLELAARRFIAFKLGGDQK